MDSIDALARAICGQESGGNTKAYNALGKAKGKYQFQQGTWNSWCKAMGLKRYVGVDPRNVSGAIQDKVARFAMGSLLKRYNGDPRYVAAAWYAGMGNADKYYKRGSFPKLKEKGGNPSVHDYVYSVMGRLKGIKKDNQVDSFISQARTPVEYSMDTTVIPRKEPSFAKKALDTVVDGAVSSPIIGGLRTRLYQTATDLWNESAHTFKLSKEDLEYIKKELPNNPAAQQYVILNAHTPETLGRLVRMKKEDIAREQRVASYGVGWGIASGLINGAVDPVIYAPLGQSLFLAKTLGKILTRVGKTGLSLNKMVKIGMDVAEISATNAALNVASAYTSEKAAGYEQNYKAAAAFGAVLAPIVHGLSHIPRNAPVSEGVQHMMQRVDNAEDLTILRAADAENLPDSIRNASTKERAVKMRDKRYDDLLSTPKTPEETKALKVLLGDNAEAHQVIVLDRPKANALARRLGVEAPKGSAFHVPNENYTVFIKDPLEGENAGKVGLNMSLEDINREVVKAILPDRGLDLLGDRAKKALKVDDVLNNSDVPTSTKIKQLEDIKNSLSEKLVQGKALGYKDKDIKTVRKEAQQILNHLGITEREPEHTRAFVSDLIQGEIDKLRGYRELEDGTVIVNGWRLSKDNIFNPVNLQNVLFESDDILADTMKKSFGKSVSDCIENNVLSGTYYGLAATSEAPVLRKIANRFFRDERMRAKNDSILSAEEMQEIINEKLLNKFKEYADGYKEYCCEQKKQGKTHLPKKEFDTQIMDYINTELGGHTSTYNQYGIDNISKYAAPVKDFFNMMCDIGRNNGKMFGLKGNMRYFPELTELSRCYDSDKIFEMRKYFDSEEKFYDFLLDHARRTVDDEKLTKRYENSKPKMSYEEFREEQCHKWAKGVSNQSMDIVSDCIGRRDKDGRHIVEQGAFFLKERLPMDTGAISVLPNGEHFTVDTHLRDTDLHQLMPMISRRFSGEMAVSNLTGDLRGLINEARVELNHLCDEKHLISRQQRERAEEVLIRSIQKIRGVSDGRVRSRAELVIDSASKLTYIQNSGNFALSQIGELPSAIGYCGLSLFETIMPKSLRIFTNLKHGKEMSAFIEEAERIAFGTTLDSEIWLRPVDTKNIIRQTGDDVISRVHQGIDTGLDYISRWVSVINMMPKLTDVMIRGTRKCTIKDFDIWCVKGKVGRSLRNPFSETKLKAAGVRDVKKLQADYMKYSVHNGKGNPVSLDVERWQQESPSTLWQWRRLIDQQSRRAITQPSIGNTSYTKEANSYMKFIYFFKDFALRAVNGQMMRALTSHEIDDAMATLYSVMSAMLVYAGLTAGKAWSNFPNDEGKRQEYLNKRLDWEHIATAGVTRSSFFTLGSFMTDAYEIATGDDSFRTSINRTSEYMDKQGVDLTAGGIAARIMGQSPVANTFNALAAIGTTGYNAIQKGYVSEKDVKRLAKNLPLNSMIPVAHFMNSGIEHLGLPEK